MQQQQQQPMHPSMMMYQQQQPPMQQPPMSYPPMMPGQPQYPQQQQPPSMQPYTQYPPQQPYPNYGNPTMQPYTQYPPQQQFSQPMQQPQYQYSPMMMSQYPQQQPQQPQQPQQEQEPMKQLPPLPMKQPVVTSTTTVTTTTIPVQSGIPTMVDSTQGNAKVQTLQHCATKWFEKRKEVLAKLAELTDQLNKRSRTTTKAKVGGTVSNIVGASLIVGGLITAPLTLGGSLVATGAGAALVGGGTAATVGAAVSEWKHAKKSAQEIQAALERDAKTVNEIIALVFDYRISDPLIEQRLLTFNIPHSTATTSIPVLQFMNALVNIKYGNINQNGQLTHGNAGATSLASLVVKGVVPIVSVPIDLCLLVSESKKLHGKEPSKLASQVAPIIDSMKYQTKMATGITSL
nr:unnamed protein product [Naegleria fowleri]